MSSFLTDKEKEEREEYKRFLEESMLLEASDAIPIPDVHQSYAKKVRDWDGTGPLPHTVDSEESEVLSTIVDKVLKREPEDDGVTDPLREDDCPDCDKHIKEIFDELGLSPIDLLEGDDEDDEDDDDDGGDAAEGEKEESTGEEEEESDELSEDFSLEENSILTQLIKEMTLMEDEKEESEVSDEEVTEEDDNNEEELED